MGVLYVLKRYPRLSETFVVNEVLALEAAGVTVGIDALLPPEDGPRHPAVDRVRARVRYLPRRPHLRWPGIAAVHARLAVRRPVVWTVAAHRARRHGEWRRFVQAGLVADRVRREGVTHVHAHFATAAAEVARDAARLAGVPFSVTAHAKDVFAEANAAVLPRRLAGAGTVVSVSAHNVAHLRDRLPRADVRLVRNGIPPAARVHRDPGGPVLAVARLVEKKGLDVLIDAVALLRDRSLRVEVVGGGPLLAALTRRAREAGVADRIVFRGPLDADGVADAYRRCAMVVLPCRVAADGDRDGLPTVLGEAMARGLPVVSTDVAGIGELVEHDATGLLVPSDDPWALAEAIARLRADRSLAERLGAAGRRRVRDEYDPAAGARALAAVFQGAAA